MDILLNPVVLSVLVLCVLCLFKVNVLLSMLLSALLAGLVGGMDATKAMNLLSDGFSANATTALAYILLGTYAVAVAYTGLMDVLVKWIGTKLGGKPVILCFILAFIACLSQNVVPIHIAFIPLLIPPLLVLFNRMRLDRRAAACALCFGLEAPYIAVPVGFGLIFQGIIADNMTSNGMKATISEVTSVNWILGLAMLAGLAFAILVSYRRKRTYEDLPVAGVEAGAVGHGSGIQYRHWVTLVSLLITVAVQIWLQSLPLAALCGLIVMFAGKAVEFKDIDEQFTKGITMMGYIAFVMLIAGGYALILKETGAVTQLVEGIVPLLGENKILTAFMITLVGLVVTMGIGTSFGTIPIVAVIYVPLCQAMGFSTAATILLISAAGALGDAGSPASDSTLGPTSGLNADGQHSHIFDTCIPTFLHYNIPLMLAAIIGAQFL
jgi:hypothetical protein